MAPASLLSTPCGFRGAAAPLRAGRSGAPVGRPRAVAVRAEAAENSSVLDDQAAQRRAVLGLLAGAVSVVGKVGNASAAFGDSARVFGGKPTNNSGFIPYSGEGFALLLPARWNPSREREDKDALLRYEDNGDNLNHVVVIKRPTDKSSVDGFGSPDKFLSSSLYKLLGEQVFSGEAREGGFKPNRVSAASVLDVQEARDKNGKLYYKYDILSRAAATCNATKAEIISAWDAADGNEGGKHHLITASVSNGQLYICKVQIGDKRWFKGAQKDGMGIFNSFVVA